MENIAVLFINNLRNIFRKKSSVLVYFIIPILCFVASFYVYGNISSKSAVISIGIINKDNKVLSKDMISYLERTKRFKFVTINESDLKAMLSKRIIEGSMIIPENFTPNIYEGKGEKISLYSIKGEEVTAIIKNYSNLYIKNLIDISKASGGDINKFNSIYKEYKNGKLKIKEIEITDKSLNNGVRYTSIGLLIMFMMFATGNVSGLMIKERRNKTYYRICSSPVNSKIYVFSNVLSSIFIVFIQISIILILLKSFDSVMLLILLSFELSAIGISMVIMAFSKSSSQGSNFSLLITMPTCMLGGCFWEASLMPKIFQKAGNFVPQKWTIDAISKLQYGMSFNEIFINIVILWAFAITLFLIAIYKMSIDDKVENFV